MRLVHIIIFRVAMVAEEVVSAGEVEGLAGKAAKAGLKIRLEKERAVTKHRGADSSTPQTILSQNHNTLGGTCIHSQHLVKHSSKSLVAPATEMVTKHNHID